jgi:hypothetical protein
VEGRLELSDAHQSRILPKMFTQYHGARILIRRLITVLSIIVVAPLAPAIGQDIRGLEVCTAEKQMDRRTGCLQANVEFLQQALAKLAHETQDRMTKADHDLALAQAEVAELKSTVAKLGIELGQMKAKEAESNSKK